MTLKGKKGMSGRKTVSKPASASRATNIRLDEALWLRVRLYAMKMRMPARAVVAQAIVEYMARNEKLAG